jgi:hypothetical protein
MIEYHLFVAISIIIILIAYGILAVKLKCPNCGGFRFRTSFVIFKLKFYIWIFWTPRKCSTCGYPLGRNRPGRDARAKKDVDKIKEHVAERERNAVAAGGAVGSTAGSKVYGLGAGSNGED